MCLIIILWFITQNKKINKKIYKTLKVGICTKNIPNNKMSTFENISLQLMSLFKIKQSKRRNTFSLKKYSSEFKEFPSKHPRHWEPLRRTHTDIKKNK